MTLLLRKLNEDNINEVQFKGKCFHAARATMLTKTIVTGGGFLIFLHFFINSFLGGCCLTLL